MRARVIAQLGFHLQLPSAASPNPWSLLLAASVGSSSHDHHHYLASHDRRHYRRPRLRSKPAIEPRPPPRALTRRAADWTEGVCCCCSKASPAPALATQS